ncbi:MAG TPA: hypothetical protein VK971_00125 [Thiohalobacter sp.]|nr:hypothetical protein [Thiohalobacter sp.]
MRIRRILMPALFGVLLAGLAEPAPAQPPRDRPSAERPGGDPGLDRAVAEIERRTGGRVLSAERVDRDGREAYRIKLLTRDGHVRVIWRDAGER